MSQAVSDTALQERGLQSSPQPICITGMHRSGTSMVARILQQAGLHLGEPADLMPPAEENPEGFFEHLGFVRLNDEVLNAAGAGWDCPPAAEFTWDAEELEPLRERARSLAAQLDLKRPWGWKDPRSSLTLPFWQSAIGPFKTIAVIRNPLEVVTSLHRRNGFSIALSLTLWRLYAERLLAGADREARLFTHFDAYFLKPEPEVARVLAFAGLEHDQDVPALHEATVPQLRHHRKTARDLEVQDFPVEVIALYHHLCREAGWWEGEIDPGGVPHPQQPVFGDAPIASGAGRVDLLRVENEALRRNNGDFSAALAAREARILELEIALQGHEVARSELEGRIKERDGRLHERHQVLARKDHAISVLQQEFDQLSAERSRLATQVTELTERLAASERGRAISETHERDLREMLTGLQHVQHQRDAEIMGTLGAALSRFAPGAPAAIYHRKLVDQVRRLVEGSVPPTARVLVATFGDGALLALGERQTEPFPRSAPGISADYTDISAEAAITQLEGLRDDGAEYLVVPGPAMPWLASHPRLARHLETRYAAVVRDRGTATIYALAGQAGQIPA